MLLLGKFPNIFSPFLSINYKGLFCGLDFSGENPGRLQKGKNPPGAILLEFSANSFS
jgi:hypothetical protein